MLSADQTTVKFLGWGTFVGREVPDEGVGGFGLFLREANQTNPKIQLDSGKVVWGCECWWGTEAQVNKMLEGRVIEQVDIDEVRKASQAEAKAE